MWRRGLSIRYKFLWTTTGLLLFCVVVYLLMASHVFREDKIKLIYDLNRNQVSRLASELDSLFSQATEKMKLVAYFYGHQDIQSLEIIKELIASHHDIVFVAGSDQWPNIAKTFYVKSEYLETYALKEDYFVSEVLKAKPLPQDQMLHQGEAIWNASLTDGPPLIGFAKSVVLEDEQGRPRSHYAVIAILRSDRLAKELGVSRLSPASILSHEGELLVSPEGLGETFHLNDQFVERMIKSPVNTFVDRIESGGKGGYLVAASRAAQGRLWAATQVSVKEAFSVVDDFIRRSLLVALMVANLALVAAILFSRSLTRPLDALMGGMKKVAEGELETEIRVQSRDELATLAESFNQMIRDLRASRFELEKINRELEDKVKERTSQLEKQNQAVKQAQEALLKSTRLASVGEIAGRAAHEVLNPLTSILARLEKMRDRLSQEQMESLSWLTETVNAWRSDFNEGGWSRLQSAWDSPSQALPSKTLWEEDLYNFDLLNEQLGQRREQEVKDVDFILSEAHRIARIVQTMRGLSAIRASLKRQALGQLIEDSLNVMRDLTSSHEIRLETSGIESSISVLADRDEFIQVLTNLIRNSIHAIVLRQKEHEPGYQGEIKVYLGSLGEDQLQVRIRDNGCGIRPDHHQRLFENQFSTKSSEEGTGLGLSISRRFVRAMGGDLTLGYSQWGEGTEFILTMPLYKKQEKAA